ncbi:hypothetical protein Pelo_3369 [Pelomyxa schiedti]|nr:hypothetical protein Pelo_3369 [Pelomyxa schiedti]
MDGVWEKLKRTVGVVKDDNCRTNNDGSVMVLWNTERWRRVCVAVIFGCTTTRVGPRWWRRDRGCDCGIRDLPWPVIKSICLLIKPAFFGFRNNEAFWLRDQGLTATRILERDDMYWWILSSNSFCLPEDSGVDLSRLVINFNERATCGWGVTGDLLTVDFNPKQNARWKKNATTRCYKRMFTTGGLLVGILGYTSEIDVRTFKFGGDFYSRPPGCEYSVILHCYNGAVSWRHTDYFVLFTPSPRNYPGAMEEIGTEFTVEVDLGAGTLETFAGDGSLAQPVALPRVSAQGKHIHWYHACALFYRNSSVKLIPTQYG